MEFCCLNIFEFNGSLHNIDLEDFNSDITAGMINNSALPNIFFRILNFPILANVLRISESNTIAINSPSGFLDSLEAFVHSFFGRFD